MAIADNLKDLAIEVIDEYLLTATSMWNWGTLARRRQGYAIG